MSAQYPGQHPQRGRSAAAMTVAIVVALVAGVGVGWTVFHHSTAPKVAASPLCLGSQADARDRPRTAACLLEAYMALTNQPKPIRDRRLADIVLPSHLNVERKTYRVERRAPINPPGQPARFAKINAEYASVVAVKPGTQLRPEAYEKPDVGYSAWMAFVDSFADGSPPLANWYLGHFAIRWQDGRWWLADPFNADQNATPTTYTGGPEKTAFGPGWVTV